MLGRNDLLLLMFIKIMKNILIKNKYILTLVIFGLFTSGVHAESYSLGGLDFVVGKPATQKQIQKNKERNAIKPLSVPGYIPGLESSGGQSQMLLDIQPAKEDVENSENPLSFLQKIPSLLNSLVFRAKTYFTETVDFFADVSFAGRVNHADRDSAGFAVIQSGQEKVAVEFEKPFVEKPIVTITPEDYLGKYTLIDSGEKGFVLVINRAQKRDVKFNWQAFAVQDPKVFGLDHLVEKEKQESQEKKVKNDNDTKKEDELSGTLDSETLDDTNIAVEDDGSSTESSDIDNINNNGEQDEESLDTENITESSETLVDVDTDDADIDLQEVTGEKVETTDEEEKEEVESTNDQGKESGEKDEEDDAEEFTETETSDGPREIQELKDQESSIEA